jgi:hypothetical protein
VWHIEAGHGRSLRSDGSSVCLRRVRSDPPGFASAFCRTFVCTYHDVPGIWSLQSVPIRCGCLGLCVSAPPFPAPPPRCELVLPFVGSLDPPILPCTFFPGPQAHGALLFCTRLGGEEAWCGNFKAGLGRSLRSLCLSVCYLRDHQSRMVLPLSFAVHLYVHTETFRSPLAPPLLSPTSAMFCLGRHSRLFWVVIPDSSLSRA